MHANASVLLAIPALRRAVESALDAGVFYQDAFESACRQQWDAVTPAVEVRLPNIHVDPKLDFETRRVQRANVVKQLESAPRGTWAVLIKPWSHSGNSGITYEALMSNGHGTVDARSDGWASEPTYEAMRDRMIGMEVYTARHAVAQERRNAAGAARLRALHIHPSITLRNVTVDGCHHFSTVVVTKVYEATGGLELYATRRGSRKRFNVHTNVLNLRLETPAPQSATRRQDAGEAIPFALA